VGATASLVKLDGTEVEFSAAPIPRSVKVKYIPDAAITDAAAQQAFEAAVALKDGAGTAVAGTYAWAADGTSALFTPDARFGYRTTYSVYVDDAAVSGASFTTLTKNDIDGDGHADLIVGALWAGQMTRDGRLYIFYGTAAGIPTCNISTGCTPGASLTGATDDWLAVSSDMVGDVNGDGYEDFIVGAPQTTGTGEGTAFVFAGGTGLAGGLSKSQALATITDSTATADDLGYSVAGAGDMNGDGYDDVVIGAPMYGDFGKAYVFLGGASLVNDLDVTAAAQTITGSGVEALGAMVDGAGDVNGDGFDDVILSSNSGHAYVLYGGATLAATRNAASADAVITGTTPFGKSVAGVGDVNADGVADVVIGEPIPGHFTRNAYVFLGGQLIGAVASTTASSKISVPDGNDDLFAATLTSAGDVDNDGKDDLLIGGYTASPGSDPGAAYVFLGANLQQTMTDADADAKILGDLANWDVLSLGLTGGADYNNDGFSDIVLGAPQYWNRNKGLTYIFNGSGTGIASCTFTAPADCSPSSTITGAANDSLGFMGSTVYPVPL
jgi:hypothetical protein